MLRGWRAYAVIRILLPACDSTLKRARTELFLEEFVDSLRAIVVRLAQNNNSDPSLQSSTVGPTLIALRIVIVLRRYRYGPLYTVKETHGIAFGTVNIFGGLQTIFWSLMIAIRFKYVTLIMRANNKGKGGSWRCRRPPLPRSRIRQAGGC